MRPFVCLLAILIVASPATAECRLIHVRDALAKRVVPVTVCGLGGYLRRDR